jgi:hypothetical protein
MARFWSEALGYSIDLGDDGWLAFVAGLAGVGIAMVVLAVIAAVDLGWIIHRKRRGEPG